MKNRSVLGWKLSESRVVSVSELTSGIQDDVVCPCCGDFMVAAHSNKGIASYLRHQSDAECRYSYETQLHLSAKEFIERTKTIPHPYSSGVFDSSDCEMVGVRNVRLEVYQDGRIPDIICQIGREEYYVEVANTHENPPNKIIDFRKQDRNALELFLVGLDSNSYLNSYDYVKVQITALNLLNPIWDFIEQQAATSIGKERSTLLRKIARHRKQVQRIAESIAEREEKADEKVAKIQRRVSKWEEKEQKQKGLYEQIKQLVDDLQTAVQRLKEEKSALNQELEKITQKIYLKNLEAEKIIDDAKQKIALEYDRTRDKMKSHILNELRTEVADAKESAHLVMENARKQESKIVEQAHSQAAQTLRYAELTVAREVESALERKNISDISLNELESRIARLKIENEELEEKKVQLEQGTNLDELWQKQKAMLNDLEKQQESLDELKKVGDKYVKIVNGIAMDLKQIKKSDYFELLPERVQKKINVNRIILDTQNSIEYEPE
ncbi:hypothetical protein [Vibrio coralliilyticus]|uniref:hypothetical protein n=1 Tax=Vibrio coralliilyticus TaxID=190893 RepID=UPI0006CE12AC|nr:hypothetical protein [Vibrio coralliilyticus]AXN29772.1 hypothetical protein DVV14_00070 [Vibrio coralliilyticus]AXN31999.1 hypothetical protein DVV14_12295 [Vibrio coralliilyticus]KPH25724.1 hypothetical protein ADU60_10800 [Vibrio coralliilyticus]